MVVLQGEEIQEISMIELMKETNALIMTAVGDHLEVMEWLVENGADVNDTDENGYSALEYAARAGNFFMVKWLVEHGSESNEKIRDGKTMLHDVASCGVDNTVKYLVDMGVSVDVRSRTGQTTLHYAAGSFRENVDLAQFLMDNGLNAFDIDKKDHTALHYAIVSRNVEIVFLFVKEACQEDELPMSELQRALFEAVRVVRLDLVHYLIESGVDVHYTNFQGRNALHEAAASASIQSIGFLLDHEVNLQQADKFGMTLVLEACRHGFLNTVQLLLEAGGSISDVNIAGQTALHLSAQNCYTEVVELLLNLDADVYQCDKRGWTPLHSAASEGHTPVVELLRANGANLDAETLSGETAEDLALKRDHDDCLRDFGAESTVLERLTSAELDPYEEFLLDPNDIFFNVNQTNTDDTLNGSWLDAPIAVKLKKRDRIVKYFVEALSQWARLNHPHIVKLYGFCHNDDEPYFVYERAMYQSLSEYQKSDNFITFGDI